MNNTTRVFLAAFAAAFVFGFIDNFILVIAGDAIDQTISAKFGFSTMFSAGLGNTISDAIGELCGGMIGAAVLLLTGKSNEDKVPHWVVATAGVAGIVIGCLVGMVPLLWI